MYEYPGCSYHVSYERERLTINVCACSVRAQSDGALLLKNRAVATSLLRMLKTIALFDDLLRERKMAAIISTKKHEGLRITAIISL